MRIRSLIFIAALGAAAVPALPAKQALGQTAPDKASLERAKKHFADGQTKYQAGDKQGAVADFKEAYKASKNAILLYNIAFVYDELHDKELAIHYYQKFLKDAPNNAKTQENRKLASDRIPVLDKELADEAAAAQKAADEAERKAAEEAAAASKPKDPVKPKGVEGFEHEILDEAPPKLPLDLTAKVPDDSDWTLTLYYRAAGEDAFKATKMNQRYDERVGRIPPTAMLGGSVQYYIEVTDPTGKLVSTSGSATSPNIIYIEKTAKPHFYRDLSENGSGSMVGEDGEEGTDTVKPIGPVGPVKDKPWKRKMWLAKVGATAATGLAITFAIVFNQTAANNSAAIEAEAILSNQEPCITGRPCRQFSALQKAYESDGKFYETMTNVMVVTSVAAAATAGVLWYLDWKAEKKRRANQRTAPKPEEEVEIEEDVSRGEIFAAPVVGEDFIGGAAVIVW